MEPLEDGFLAFAGRKTAVEVESVSARHYDSAMKLTAVFQPAEEGGFSCFIEEIPAAISEGDTLEEAEANLRDALRLVIECQREISEKELTPHSIKRTFDLVSV